MTLLHAFARWTDAGVMTICGVDGAVYRLPCGRISAFTSAKHAFRIAGDGEEPTCRYCRTGAGDRRFRRSEGLLEAIGRAFSVRGSRYRSRIKERAELDHKSRLARSPLCSRRANTSKVLRMRKRIEHEQLPPRLRKLLRVDITGCWLFTGKWTSGNGYGKLRWNKKHTGVHRAAWEATVGPICPTFVLDHTCRVRRCGNPNHLEPVPNVVNTHRGEAVLYKKMNA